MTAPVSTERWREAQAAEQSYWQALGGDPLECARVLAEKVAVAVWIERHLPAAPPGGQWAEIGIGPLGMGCIHFLHGQGDPGRVGIEPLSLLAEEQLRLPGPLVEAVAACRRDTGAYVRAPGEATGLAAECFALVVSYNVLDHVRDPGAVLAEAHRILTPGGLLALGCDTVSVLSDLRFRWIERRHADSIGVRAHPFRFRLRDLEALVGAAGFRVLASNRPSRPRLSQIAGHAHRLLLLAEKRASTSRSEGREP